MLNSVPLVSLLDAARELDGVEFFHGTRQQMTQFSILNGEAAQRACLEWAAVFGLEDVQKLLVNSNWLRSTRGRALHFVLLVGQPESLESEREASAALCPSLGFRV